MPTSANAQPIPTEASNNNLLDLLAAAVRFAEEDWRAGTAEELPPPQDGPLAQIFRDSGYCKYGVDYKVLTDRQGHDFCKITDWCGLAVAAWLVRAGLAPGLRKTFFHTSNVFDFFTYSEHPSNSDRTKNKIYQNGHLYWLKDFHDQRGTLRLWQSYADVRGASPDTLEIAPGDVVLINHRGRTDGANHITMVRSWNAPLLETIEGNASGLNADGQECRQSVVVNQRDLSDPEERNQIFGIGRVSQDDFLALDYRS